MGEFRMPVLGAGMETGRLVAWYVAVGDEVHRGELIALVETDKANIDVEVFEDGVVTELLVAEGTKVPVGTALACIDAGRPVGVAAEPAATAPAVATRRAAAVAAETSVREAPPAASPSAPAAVAAAAPVVAATESRVVSPLVRREVRRCGLERAGVVGSGPGGVVTRRDVARAADRLAASRAVRASPYARCLAAARDLDLGGITGSGPGGAVVARDLPVPSAPAPTRPIAAAGSGPARTATPRPAVDRGVPTPTDAAERARSMRLAIARAMEQANRDIPHYHLGETVDVEDTLVWLAARNATLPPSRRLLPAVLVLRATALALRAHPGCNGFWQDDAFVPGPGIHLGVAVSLRGGGLIAPAILAADELDLDALMAALRDLVTRTRSGGLTGTELTAATITVSNLGNTGVETLSGVITPPQVALVGAGRITARPWVVDDEVRVRRTLALSLAGDHRATDGHRGARFLGAIATHLRRPETL